MELSWRGRPKINFFQVWATTELVEPVVISDRQYETNAHFQLRNTARGTLPQHWLGKLRDPAVDTTARRQCLPRPPRVECCARDRRTTAAAARFSPTPWSVRSTQSRPVDPPRTAHATSSPPNGSGCRSPSVWSSLICRPGRPASYSNCRQRPHGYPIRKSSTSRPATTATAKSLPPPLAWSAGTGAHSAHSASPYEAFSTLQPSTTRPSSSSPAAPT